MVINPDRTADEALLLRHNHVNGTNPHPDPDIELARRIERNMQWHTTNPALDELADRRLTALARLSGSGSLPDPGCTVRVAHTQFAAKPDAPPCEHRYAVLQYSVHQITGQERIGTAWLSTEPDTRGLYEAVRHGIRGAVRGSTLFEAVERLALLIDAEDRARRDARRGAVR